MNTLGDIRLELLKTLETLRDSWRFLDFQKLMKTHRPLNSEDSWRFLDTFEKSLFSRTLGILETIENY